jgi:hypothetical protein
VVEWLNFWTGNAKVAGSSSLWIELFKNKLTLVSRISKQIDLCDGAKKQNLSEMAINSHIPVHVSAPMHK